MNEERKRKSALLALSAILEQDVLMALVGEKEDFKLKCCTSFLETLALVFALKSAYLEEKKQAEELWEYCHKGLLRRVEMLESYFERVEREKILSLTGIEFALAQGKRALEEKELPLFIETVDGFFESLGISSEEMEKELSEANAFAKATALFLTEKPQESAPTAVIQI